MEINYRLNDCFGCESMMCMYCIDKFDRVMHVSCRTNDLCRDVFFGVFFNTILLVLFMYFRFVTRCGDKSLFSFFEEINRVMYLFLNFGNIAFLFFNQPPPP